MDFGRIKRDTEPITLQEWTTIIVSNSALEQMPDLTAINPFTKEKLFAPGEGKAYYVVDGERIGNASLEEGEILTTGIPREFCDKIALSLNAETFEDDRS